MVVSAGFAHCEVAGTAAAVGASSSAASNGRSAGCSSSGSAWPASSALVACVAVAGRPLYGRLVPVRPGLPCPWTCPGSASLPVPAVVASSSLAAGWREPSVESGQPAAAGCLALLRAACWA